MQIYRHQNSTVFFCFIHFFLYFRLSLCLFLPFFLSLRAGVTPELFFLFRLTEETGKETKCSYSSNRYLQIRIDSSVSKRQVFLYRPTSLVSFSEGMERDFIEGTETSAAIRNNNNNNV